MTFRQKISFRKQLRNTLLITSGLLALGILAIFYFSGKIDESTKNSVRNRLMLLAQDRELNNFNRLKIDYAKVKDYIPRLKNNLPSTDELIVLTSQFDAEAARVGASSRSMFVQVAPAAGSEPKGYIIKIELNGTGDQFVDYLRAIGRMPYFINVTNFDVTSSEGLQKPSLFTINGKIYIR